MYLIKVLLLHCSLCVLHSYTSGDICQSKVGIFEEHISCYLVTLVTCILLYMLNIYDCSLFGQHHTCYVPVYVCVCVFVGVCVCGQ